MVGALVVELGCLTSFYISCYVLIIRGDSGMSLVPTLGYFENEAYTGIPAVVDTFW